LQLLKEGGKKKSYPRDQSFARKHRLLRVERGQGKAREGHQREKDRLGGTQGEWTPGIFASKGVVAPGAKKKLLGGKVKPTFKHADWGNIFI